MGSKWILCIGFSVLTFFGSNLQSQENETSTLQGVLWKDGAKMTQGLPFYVDFRMEKNQLIGKTREEIYGTPDFAVKKMKGTKVGEELHFQQFVIEKKNSSSNLTWCNYTIRLTYEDSTGYYSGTFESTDCKRNTGKIRLFAVKRPPISSDNTLTSHSWFDVFCRDYLLGLPAPAVREKERQSFVFQPLYFDYDSYAIRPEYHAYLLKMARIVAGHSDIRILVVGHTDSDGSDAYNITLSQKRAEALIDFFGANGLNTNRISIDFKGEKEPVDSNETPDGKQRNRRVDFAFSY